MLKNLAAFAFVAMLAIPATAQLRTNVDELRKSAEIQKIKAFNNYQRALVLAQQKGWQTRFSSGAGNIATLVGVDSFDRPVYFITESNVIAAATTGASQLWVGGSSGLNLNGSSNSVKSKMAVWDGGKVLNTHVELTGRVVQQDGATSISDHATHVSGTMIASGVNPNAKGMAYGMQELLAYDFNSHTSEMLFAAPNLLLSNHSYGTLTGWNYNTSLNRWEYYGGQAASEDANFGYYNSEAQMFDSIAYNAPYYLIVKSAGNNRASNGPAVGETYYYFSGGNWVPTTRVAGISSNDGYDIISTYGTAKNILTVGAVNGIANGYTNVNDVVMSSFSSWGPTDDGRIKPDVVADGVNLTSSIGASNNSYGIYSGTSMAAPNSTGSLLLLQEYYAQLHAGNFMRSATLKGLAIHCAEESGPAPGPDYKFGWGLLNVAKAAQVIKSNNLLQHQMFENVLTDGQTYTMNVVASGPLTATLVWTDPKGAVTTSNILDNTTKKLVNDLDMRITQGTTVSMPWILDPANPDNPATTGDNTIDNVEKININAAPGIPYTITITHKGTLERGQQAYSLILSGVNGQVFCTSVPASTAGARIDSVSFGSIQHQNTISCSGYTDLTAVTTTVEPNQVLPISVKVNSCDATATDKIVKVYIDYNNNGSFTDAGENVATSNVINGDGVFNAQITIPGSIIIGNPSVMRVIVQETSNAGDVSSCGSYSKGETQDYRLIFATPSNDLKADAIVDPAAPGCANPNQLVTVRLKNSGTAPQTNLPLSLEIKTGSTVVANLNAVYPGTIPAGETRNYTFQVPFNSQPSTSYALTLVVNTGTDQNRSNDTLKTTINIPAQAAAPAGQARICDNQAILLASNPTTPGYFWYTDPNGSPIGVGLSVFTPNIPANNTYYLATGARMNAGLTSKSAFANGGDYLSNTNSFIKYTSATPLYLESAKMYSKYGGKVEFIVADITSETGTSFTYNTLSTKVIDIYATSPNTAPGTQNGYDAADTGAVFNLNIYLPAGNHALIVKTQGNTNLFRNNNVTGNPYPYGIPNLVTVTGNSAATEGGSPQNYYYFLYDMKLRTNECVSNKATIVATVAPTPVITRNGNTLSSSSASGNQWYLNGNLLNGATGQNYTALSSGNYTVSVTDAFGCLRTSNAMNVTFTAVDPVNTSALELAVTPNPSSGRFELRFRADRKEDITIEVINAQGQRVHTKAYPKFAGLLTEQVNLEKVAAGMYVIRLLYGNRTFTRKLVIE